MSIKIKQSEVHTYLLVLLLIIFVLSTIFVAYRTGQRHSGILYGSSTNKAILKPQSAAAQLTFISNEQDCLDRADAVADAMAQEWFSSNPNAEDNTLAAVGGFLRAGCPGILGWAL